jgi:hypothetical protein
MADTSALDLVWHMADFYPAQQHTFAIALALDGRYCHRVFLQRIGRYADAASGFGFGISIVVVDFFLRALARLGLAVAFGFGLADLPHSLLA